VPIRYAPAEDIEKRAREIVYLLKWDHVFLEHVGFIRSKNSGAKRTIARCHALGKAMQLGMKRQKSFYVIEVLSEKFDKLKYDEQTEVIIHELMHIPKTFGGGFVHHDRVSDKAVKEIFQRYLNLRDKELKMIRDSFN
jgi:predicted metallopeptidase